MAPNHSSPEMQIVFARHHAATAESQSSAVRLLSVLSVSVVTPFSQMQSTMFTTMNTN